MKLTTPENIITYHNALCLSPQILHKHGPKRNWKQCLFRFLGWQTKSIMVCYGIFWSGQLLLLPLGIVLDAMRFHGSGAILDWLAGTFCLDLMFSCSPGSGIYYVTLVYHRWNSGEFVFAAGLFIVFSHSFQLTCSLFCTESSILR